jgi:hypothetical protein
VHAPRDVTRDLYLEWRSPRVGQRNPDCMTNPVWSWLARAGDVSAYQANRQFEGPSSLAAGPAWCCARFGQSRTELADGRVVRIAGEHEDYYDPDFFIYNDVIVEAPDGAIAIYGYPHDVFAPTDFHSATVVGDDLFVIGNLGYADRRRIGATPVARLDLRTLAMSPVPAAGASPGWIHRHAATLSADGRAIAVTGGSVEVDVSGARHLVDNPDDWSLDVATLSWTRHTDRRWQQWELRRADGSANELWRREMAYRFGGKGAHDPWLFEKLGDPEAVLANRPLYEARYSPPVAHERLPDDEETPAVLRRVVENVVVRYVEEMHAVRVVVEGALAQPLVDTIVDDACSKLAALEGGPYAKTRAA